MTKSNRKTAQDWWQKILRVMKGDWGFPIVLTLILLLLTAAKVSGSSIGIYQNYFYPGQKDPALLLNQPEAVRSDEFLVNTQMTLAQSRDHYPATNRAIGNGEDMALTLDVPYKSWSEAFKPHNWAFFVLPVEYAFAFKWWLMAYLLLLSCYFFVLSLLPGKRLLAAALAISLLFSAFTQWWYQYITLGPLYYSLFLATGFVHFLRQKTARRKLLWAALISYAAACFALVLYPPFQIACAFAAAGFLVGELIVYYKKVGRRKALGALGWLASSLVVAMLFVGLFILSQHSVIRTIDNTVYPGHRLTHSGGFSVAHLLTGNLGHQFLSPVHTADYRLLGSPTNQSESSNFVLLTPFLFLPSLYLLYKDKRKNRPTDWALLATNVVFVIFLLQLFLAAFNPISGLLLFNRIPPQRLLIGLGLLNIVQLVLLIRNLSAKKPFSQRVVLPYVLLVFVVELSLGLHIHRDFPGFIGRLRLVAFCLPVPIVVYSVLRKHFRVGVLIFMLFCLYISVRIHPLYRGMAVLKSDPVSVAVQQVVHSSPDARWVTDGLYLENFALINGAHSLSGVYYYPQPDLWKNIGPGDQSVVYNRYANVNFSLQDSSDPNATQLQLVGPDHFQVVTDACSSYLRAQHVQYLLTTSNLSNSCASLVRQVVLPGGTFSIYKLN
jgi:hypothetical protein